MLGFGFCLCVLPGHETVCPMEGVSACSECRPIARSAWPKLKGLIVSGTCRPIARSAWPKTNVTHRVWDSIIMFCICQNLRWGVTVIPLVLGVVGPAGLLSLQLPYQPYRRWSCWLSHHSISLSAVGWSYTCGYCVGVRCDLYRGECICVWGMEEQQQTLVCGCEVHVQIDEKNK